MVEFAIESKLQRLHFVLPLLIVLCYKREDRAPEYSLFVGDLSNDVDETFLLVSALLYSANKQENSIYFI